MNIFSLDPYKGIGPIKIGTRISDVISILGTPESTIQNNDITQVHYSCFCIHFNKLGLSEFIAASLDKDCSVQFLGMDLLREKASKVVDVVSKSYDYDESDFELGYSYIYPEIQLSFYRPTMPESESDAEGMYFQVACIAEPNYWSKNA